MGLSCGCDFGDYDWCYIVEEGERSACAEGVCYGCYGKISIGDEVRFMTQYETDDNGYDINRKSLGRLCPVCSGLYDSLLSVGFCLTADWGFVKEALQEYQNDYTPPKIGIK